MDDDKKLPQERKPLNNPENPVPTAPGQPKGKESEVAEDKR